MRPTINPPSDQVRIATVSLALVTALGVAGPAVAGAQARRDSLAADSAARRLKPVHVTEARAAALVGGASALIVTTDELRSSPAPALDQLLRETPSVYVRQNSRGEMELSVRGSNSRQVAVMLDGVPLTLGWDHRTDPSLVPITGSEAVVIVRGLGSLLGGPNTLGGTISISQNGAQARSGDGNVWGGIGVDATTAFVASAGVSRTTALAGGLVTMQGGLARRDRDGVTLPGGATDPTSHDGLRTNSDLRETDAFASLHWKHRGGKSLGVTVTGFTAVRGVPPEEHLESPRLWRYPYSNRGIVALSASSGPFETPFGFGTIDLSAGYNAGRQKIESFGNRTYTSVIAEELGDERTATLRGYFSHSLPRGAKLESAVTLADVRYTETLARAAGVDFRQVLWSGGAEVDAPIGANTTIAVGAVFDKSRTPLTGGRQPGQPPLDDIGWRAGVVHELNPAWRLHANASRRSRFPALRELYSGALDRFRPNPDLKPESLLGLEGGVTFRDAVGAIPDASVQLTAFHHTLHDAVARITLSNPARFMRVNRDRIESSGLELVSGLVFGADAERTVSLTGDGTVQRIRVVDPTAGDAVRRSENNPQVRGTLTLGVPLPLRLRWLGTARYTGAQYCLHAELGQDVELAAQAVADVSFERSFRIAGNGPFRVLRALFSFDNVANAAVYDQCGLPQPGRTVRMMVSVR